MRGPRRVRPTAAVTGVWAASVLLGAAAIGVHAASGPDRRTGSRPAPGPTPTSTGTPAPSPTSTGTLAPVAALLPEQVPAALATLVGAGATDLRVASLQGSGHDGDWSYSAYLTWRDPGGTRRAAITALPFPGGLAPATQTLTAAQQTTVDRAGWTVPALSTALGSAISAVTAAVPSDTDAPTSLDLAVLGHLEIDGPLSADPTLLTCTAAPASGTIGDHGTTSGSCTQTDQTGHRATTTRTLSYDHDTGALTAHVGGG